MPVITDFKTNMLAKWIDEYEHGKRYKNHWGKTKQIIDEYFQKNK